MASAICRWRSPRSDCLYSSSHSRPSHFNPSKMELTEASVLRSTSVSSSRKIIVPPFRRAYNQLRMKVRALPTCRNPVGEGAKRTLGLPCEGGFRVSGIGNQEEHRLGNPSSVSRIGRRGPLLSKVRWTFDGTGTENHRQAGLSERNCAQPFDFKKISKAGVVLKTCCVPRLGMKTLMNCFPPKLSQHVWPEVSLPAL